MDPDLWFPTRGLEDDSMSEEGRGERIRSREKERWRRQHLSRSRRAYDSRNSTPNTIIHGYYPTHLS